MTWHRFTRLSPLFFFVTLWGYELSTEEEWCKPLYAIAYNHGWPSDCYWMVPK